MVGPFLVCRPSLLVRIMTLRPHSFCESLAFSEAPVAAGSISRVIR